MRNILLLVVMFISTALFAQDYPIISNENGKVLVTFTLEQAQKIDNDLQMLKMFQKMNVDLNRSDSVYIEVIDSQNNLIAGLGLEISALESLLSSNNALIDNLKSQISEYKAKDDICKAQHTLKDSIIIEKNKEIKKLKRQKMLGFVGYSTAIAILILIIIAG